MPDTSVQPTSDLPLEALAPPAQAPAPVRRTETIVTPEMAARELYGSTTPPDTSKRGEVLKYMLSILILGAGVGLMYLLYVYFKSPPPGQPPSELIPMVDTEKASPYSGELDRVISGTVVPYREIRVAAEISGNIIKKYDEFEAGNFVEKNTKLLEIDPADYQLLLETGQAEVEQSRKMMEETQAELAGAKRNLEIAKTEFKLAEVEFDRNFKLHDVEALSDTELDQAKRNRLSFESALTTKQNNFDMLKARALRMAASLKLAEAQLRRTALNLTKTTIVAPDNGVIVREMVQEGDFVRAGDELVMFEDTSRSEVICNLTPTDLAWIRDNAPSSSEFRDEEQDDESWSVYHIPKTKVSVSEIADPKDFGGPSKNQVVWEGVLERFDGIGRDASTRTIPCRITIKNPIVNTDAGKRALVRGMYVKCSIKVPTSADSSNRSFLSFPAIALQPGRFVWVVEGIKTSVGEDGEEVKTGRLKKVSVEVVDYSEQLIGTEKKKIVIAAISEGQLQPGDVIVKGPIKQPSTGAEVILENDKANDGKPFAS